jgi:hypothetical protein
VQNWPRSTAIRHCAGVCARHPGDRRGRISHVLEPSRRLTIRVDQPRLRSPCHDRDDQKTICRMVRTVPQCCCVVSLLDRLVHHAKVIAVEGKSYRLKETRERTSGSRYRRACGRWLRLRASSMSRIPDSRNCLREDVRSGMGCTFSGSGGSGYRGRSGGRGCRWSHPIQRVRSTASSGRGLSAGST